LLTTTPWPRPTPAGVATARGGESPRAWNGAQREWKAPWSAQTKRSAVRKTGETPCGRGGRRSLGRVFAVAVAVAFVVVFGCAGYELAGSGSLLNPRRPESAPRDSGSVLVRNRSSFAESAHRRSDAEVHADPPREITADRWLISPARAETRLDCTKN
jgi:hypothetical protein